MNVSVDRPRISRSISHAHNSKNEREDSFPIPDDVIMEIFSRLSLKVARCRCVSKLWASVLSRQDFTDLFLIKSSVRPQLLFLCRRLNRILFFSSPPPQNPDENSSPIDMSYDMSFPLIVSQICRPINGLMCVSNASWRDIKCCIPQFTRHMDSPSEICINGVLYYKAAVDECKSDSMIVCFDVRSEKFKVIQVAESFIRMPSADLMNYNGKLGTCVCPTYGYVDSRRTSMQLWVLEDADNQEWSKHEYMHVASFVGECIRKHKFKLCWSDSDK